MDHYNYFKNSFGNRDIVFDTILNHFRPAPISILEIGCARDLNKGSRDSDGWSSIHWADYVKEYGGTIDIVDISEESISNCRHLLKEISGFASFHINGRWNQWDGYDVIFLDAGDDPDLMLSQFKKCEDKAVILCDDFHQKGSKLKEYRKPDTIWIWNNGHEMGCYGISLGEIHLKIK